MIRRRRMVREYLDTPVPADALQRIVDAAVKTPSAGFSQGQSLVVVIDKGQRERIAKSAREREYIGRGFEPWLSVAPVHFVITVSEQAYIDRYRENDKLGPEMDVLPWDVPYWWVDGGATMMAILLAAVAEGLAAGFLGAHNFENLRSIVGIPNSESVLGVVTVGYEAHSVQESRSLPRRRRPRSEVVHWDRW